MIKTRLLNEDVNTTIARLECGEDVGAELEAIGQQIVAATQPLLDALNEAIPPAVDALGRNTRALEGEP